MGLQDWVPPCLPPRVKLSGRYVQLEPLERAHISGLMAAFEEDAMGAMWRFLPVGPFDVAG